MLHRSAGAVTRRGFLTGTALALAGTAGSSRSGQPAPVAGAGVNGTFGKAKSVIILYLYGAPSQMDTLDPKPDAPAEQRGEFGTIPTALPGVRVCEYLPGIAAELDQMCLVRSMSHASNNHAVSVALSGLSQSLPAIEANRAAPQHWPYIGSVLEYLWKHQGVNADTDLPLNVILPWPLNARTDPSRWSPHAAWLGPAYNPVYPLFRGAGSRPVGNPTANGPTALRSQFDPYDGVTPPSTFAFEGAELPDEVSAVRFGGRLQLLENLEGAQDSDGPGPVAAGSPALDRFVLQRQSAARLIADPRLALAVDVTREPWPVRERYGLTLFGMEALAARRLVEAGVKVVTAFWDDYAYPNNAWDTHFNHFPRLRE
jgi:hypothetical protein